MATVVLTDALCTIGGAAQSEIHSPLLPEDSFN